MAELSTGSNIADQAQTLVTRAIDRNIKGLEYFRSPSPQVGVTPKALVHQRGTMKLYHYHAQASEVYRVPVLVVMATTNRGAVFDLTPGHSFVEFLLKQGYDVYMLDWEAPLPYEKKLDLADYTTDFIPDCLSQICARSGEPDVTMVGYCMGGVLSLIYNALHTDGPVRNLVNFTTPVDFSKMGFFSNIVAKEHFDVDMLVDTIGNVPGDVVLNGFSLQRPSSRSAAQLRLYDNMWNDAFVEHYRKVDRWAMDMLPLAGNYFRDTIKKLIWENGLMTGKLHVGGRPADLSAIKIPFLHVIAEHDELVPHDASKPLIDLIGSKSKDEITLKGGHVSLIAGPNAARRLWPQLDLWLQEKSV